MQKQMLIELVQSKKRKPLWLRPDKILYFEKISSPTLEEIGLHLTNGRVFRVLDNESNRKKLQLQFKLV